jgi:hypothetical protein
MADQIDELDLVDEQEAASILRCAVSTLQKKRVSGGGPIFVKFGRLVRYPRGGLRAHIRENIRRSTSDAA